METGARTQAAFARADGIGLRVEMPDGNASVLLRRRDMGEDERFREYHGAPVGPAVLAMFLPHWQGLPWRKVPPHLLSRGEVVAEDGDYYVTVVPHLAKDACHEQAIRAFELFMRAGAESE